MALSRYIYVNLLRSQNGYREGRNNWTKYPPAVRGLEWAQNQPWCHTFVSWGADELGERNVIPITASCASGVSWFKARDRWTEYPVLGGPFYMGSAGQDHVGVVYAYDADWIYTIEGNTNAGGSANGDGVYERKRPRRGAGSPYGYGVPAFAEGTISADPKYGGTKSAAVAKQAPQEDDMPSAQEIASAVWSARIPGKDEPVPAGDSLGWSDARHNVIYAELQQLKAEHAVMKAQLAKILAAVTQSN
ncbi:MAG TPA: hypothetical protein VJQ57_13970 [Acidimicrobiia bacterium]|nr:hypothetical protein [Acidimicrobiia bacterium]